MHADISAAGLGRSCVASPGDDLVNGTGLCRTAGIVVDGFIRDTDVDDASVERADLCRSSA